MDLTQMLAGGGMVGMNPMQMLMQQRMQGDGQQGGFLNLKDAFDGGGMGASGSEFQGGPFSGAANAMGIAPFGSQVGGDVRPQMRPPMPQQNTMPSQMPTPQMPAPSQAPQLGGPGPIPQGNDEYARWLKNAYASLIGGQ